MSDDAKSDPLFDRLREAIRADGRSLAEIAKAAGINGPNLSRFLAGTKGVSFPTGVTLAAVVGMPLGRVRSDKADDSADQPNDVRSDKTDPAPLAEVQAPTGPCLHCGRSPYDPLASSPGTSLAICKPSMPPRLTYRSGLTEAERNKRKRLGMFVPDA